MVLTRTHLSRCHSGESVVDMLFLGLEGLSTQGKYQNPEEQNDRQDKNKVTLFYVVFSSIGLLMQSRGSFLPCDASVVHPSVCLVPLYSLAE